ncbi:MAG: imidazoleglycerol-phosphate dehydratase HisB [Oscillospiraceae bacterium]|jgi:imidazoleglycerol-phosphate dehydratase|nr:imidazoleglycerol-phosphate dehydratase HisB [Oscillospiraceae bacterium]
MRTATIKRDTLETQISLTLSLEGGEVNIATGVGFLDHMLNLFARHGGFGLMLTCRGDTAVDDHHSVEDCGIALGEAFRRALGDCRGIARYGSFLLPMDEALVQVALDISGRCNLAYGLHPTAQKIGSFDTELVQEFLLGMCRSMGLTLHITQLAGTNAHHIVEAAFKGLGRALAIAVRIDPERAAEIPSTKGVIA